MEQAPRFHIFESVAAQVTYAKKVFKEHPEYVNSVWGQGLDGIADNDDVGRKFPKGWDELFEAATSAWAEGEKLLADAMKELKDLELPIPESIRRRQSWSDMDGETVEPSRILNGEPYWRFCNRKQAVGGCPNITLLCNNGTSYNHTPDTIVWRGIAAMLITDILEDAGYRVELWCIRDGCEVFYDSAPGLSDDQMTAVLLKESHGPLVRPLLVSVISGWYYRTITWLSYYDLAVGQQPSSGLGCPQSNISQFSKEAIAGTQNTGHFFEIDQLWNAEECVKCVKKVIEEFNPSAVLEIG